MTGIDLPDPAATEAAGRILAPLLRIGDRVTLSGDLGAGKTAFARGVLAGLGHHGEVPSPTFAIVQPYAPPEVRLPVQHVDFYRLDDPDDVDETVDFETPGALIVEWPERAHDRLWTDALRLRFDPDGQGGRRLTWQVPAAWEGRWPPPDLAR